MSINRIYGNMLIIYVSPVAPFMLQETLHGRQSLKHWLCGLFWKLVGPVCSSWMESVCFIWELIRNTDSQTPPQTHPMRIYVLADPSDVRVQPRPRSSVGSRPLRWACTRITQSLWFHRRRWVGEGWDSAFWINAQKTPPLFLLDQLWTALGDSLFPMFISFLLCKVFTDHSHPSKFSLPSLSSCTTNGAHFTFIQQHLALVDISSGKNLLFTNFIASC